MLELTCGTSIRDGSAFTEVAVRRPSRGWIDAVLHEPRERGRRIASCSPSCVGSNSSSAGRAPRPSRCPVGTGWPQLGDEREVAACSSSGGHGHPRRGRRVRAPAPRRLPGPPGRCPRRTHRHHAVAGSCARLGRAGSHEGALGVSVPLTAGTLPSPPPQQSSRRHDRTAHPRREDLGRARRHRRTRAPRPSSPSTSTSSTR